VILNSNPEAHLADLKKMPVVESEVDKCIECGYCEPKCPSRDLTLTPRQRIVVRREMQRLEDAGASGFAQGALADDFQYMALDTCAVDGLCATACPVDIDTGGLTKRLRGVGHTAVANRVATATAKHFRLVEVGARAALVMGHMVQKVFGLSFLQGITRALNRVTRTLLDEPFWQWSAEMPRARRGPLPVRAQVGAEAVYFPACLSRIMGAIPGEQNEMSVMQAMLNVADRAGVTLHVPGDVAGNCCGVPFSSKGFAAAHEASVNHTVENFFRWSDGGKLPVVVDTSPCTYGLKTARPHLTAENQARFDALTIVDSIEFAHDYLLHSLPLYRKVDSVALHPVCSAVKMAITPKLVQIAQACSEVVSVPTDAGCCAFAGDRGFLFPELTASATETEAREVCEVQHSGYYSSSRTCEIGMTRATGKTYQSYLHLLEYASRSDLTVAAR
jgi:D-lactate dehydrogenase